MKVLSIFGTRPEAIKMAPLVKQLTQVAGVESQIAVTAQHREMLDQVLELFQITPDYDLNLMRHGQSLTDLTAGALTALAKVLEQTQPDLVLVHGDTTTTFAGALAAFYQQIALGHVEAGLRTTHKYAPFPEEMNRRLTGNLADWHFAPTATARENLLAEGVPAERIFVTGNTVIDALLEAVEKPYDLTADPQLQMVDWSRRVVLLTCHRRENWGQPMAEIFTAVADLLHDFPELQIVFPLHKNPKVRAQAYEKLRGLAQIHFTEPLDYLPMCKVMQQAYLVISDSGGLQEEAPALGKPVLVLRETTERPEAIAAGTARLAGTSREGVYRMAAELLTDSTAYAKMAHAINPYGDGQASRRICDIIQQGFQ